MSIKERAIILPSVGDPLLINFWHKCFLKNLSDTVNTVYLKMTNNIDKNARNFIVNKLNQTGKYKVWATDIADVHGNVIRDLMEHVTEENVVLLEDDFFVTTPNALDKSFQNIENGTFDCIGSSRGCCTVKMVNAITKAFDLCGKSPEHALSDCPNFWPCLFFAKTETLRKTDGHYAAQHWPQGTTVPCINMLCDDAPESGDSFVWTSIQLRNQGNKFGYLHQHHTGPDDLQDYPRQTGLFSYNPIPWVHVGSLSSGIVGLLKYDNDVPLNYGSPEGIVMPYPSVDHTTFLEYSRRLAMFKFVADHGKLEDPDLDYYNKIYSDAVDRAIKEMGLPMETVQKFYDIMTYIFASTLGL